MAIFAGTWFDGQGNPFDPSAQPSREFPGGGVAFVTRHGRPYSGVRAHFALCVSAHAAFWTNVMSDQDRQEWADIGNVGVLARGQLFPTGVAPFVPYNAMAFVHCFYPDGMPIKPPLPHNVEISELRLLEPDVDNQVVRFHYEYTADWAATVHATLAIYQVKPKYYPTGWRLRSTRLIHKRITWNPEGETVNSSAPARFEFAEKWEVSCLFRAHSGQRYIIDTPDQYVGAP